VAVPGPELIRTLADVAGRYDAFYVDLWGCVHDGVAPYPAAVAALRAVRAQGRPVVLLTNSPRTAAGVAEQLDALGLPRDCWDAIASSGEASRAALVAGVVGRQFWHLGPDRDDSLFRDLPPGFEKVPPDRAEGIVCTGLFDDRPEPSDYRGQLLLARQRDLPMLCVNPDVVVDRGGQRMWCAGALAEVYAGMGGTVHLFGKPHPPIYDLAGRLLAGLLPGKAEPDVLAIGDGIATDIAGALAEGLDSLFVTGGLAAAETGTNTAADPDPDRLRAFLAAHEMSPLLAIGFLR